LYHEERGRRSHGIGSPRSAHRRVDMFALSRPEIHAWSKPQG